ncbi:hypothetical protein PCASD_12721 [Puccinia coronata f. sp. avenae]|uniref:No apical meristem-associated C-terminal domain-containing protein n=1 Tax=Puccinia coronata f. sp. avenae TaxID=200324 RepID=A0A2N5UCK7_9BASI|nr:hypothetical protein PCASD_12721 [Puccinia coronata f. sp. avenae]
MATPLDLALLPKMDSTDDGKVANVCSEKKKNSAKKEEDDEDGSNKDSDGSNSDEAKGSKKKTRSQNYHEDKNLQLCTSWLETTEDGRKGTNQTGNAFWATVAKHYTKQMPNPVQSTKSLKKRWGVIQQAVNKFHGCVQQINHWNPSGTSSSDRNSMALSLYSKLQGKPFTPTPGSLPSSAPTMIQVDSDGSGDETSRAPPERPIGRKKSKVAYQEQQLEASNHEQIKKMAMAHFDIAIITKKQQETLDAQNGNLQRLADEAIMCKDLTGASEMVKRFYEIEQKKIMARLEAELEKSAE